MPPPYKRIMIFGRPGSGKSTFAIALHKATGLPRYHLDKYFYVDNWVERNYEQFLEMQYAIVKQEEWIIDGNNTKSLHVRWKQAELVLYLNYSRWLCFARIFKRLIARRCFGSHKSKTFDDRAQNCKEQVRWQLLKYMFSFDKRVRPIICLMQQTCPATPFFELHNDTELQELACKIGLEN